MKSIIIVDDDPGIQDAFCRILARAGYAVTVYANGQRLLSGDFTLPDVFMLDRQLSGADGLDICRFLKQQPRSRNIPVIMLSASPHIEPLALEAKADAFLEKPFKVNDLLEMLEKWTNR